MSHSLVSSSSPHSKATEGLYILHRTPAHENWSIKTEDLPPRSRSDGLARFSTTATPIASSIVALITATSLRVGNLPTFH